VITVQTSRGFEFWPDAEVASIIPEFRNWWTVVKGDGQVAHLLADRPPDFGVALGDSRVNPRFLTKTTAGYLDPAHFLHPLGELAVMPEEPPGSWSEGLPCPPARISDLQGKQGKWVWRTDDGFFPLEMPLQQALLLMPELVLLKRGLFINRRRLRHIRIDVTRRFFCLENGTEYRVKCDQTGLAERLGLPNLTGFHPRMTGRIEFGLRDWPWELSLAPTEFLKEHFSNPRQLIAHLIWQRFRYRSRGVKRRWCKGYGSFWYEVVAHALQRAGFLRKDEVTQRVGLELSRRDSRANELYHVMHAVMDIFIDVGELFSYQQFGFVDPEPWRWSVGAARPHVLLFSEKDDLSDYSKRLVEESGVSYCQLEGMPWRLRSEYFAQALLAAGIRTVYLIIYGDYDDGGWWVGQAAGEQLGKLGLAVASIEYVLTEKVFTAEEKALHARPCGGGGKRLQSRARNWVARGFGIDGQCLGIHAEYYQPFQRVRERFQDCLSLVQ